MPPITTPPPAQPSTSPESQDAPVPVAANLAKAGIATEEPLRLVRTPPPVKQRIDEPADRAAPPPEAATGAPDGGDASPTQAKTEAAEPRVGASSGDTLAPAEDTDGMDLLDQWTVEETPERPTSRRRSLLPWAITFGVVVVLLLVAVIAVVGIVGGTWSIGSSAEETVQPAGRPAAPADAAPPGPAPAPAAPAPVEAPTPAPAPLPDPSSTPAAAPVPAPTNDVRPAPAPAGAVEAPAPARPPPPPATVSPKPASQPAEATVEPSSPWGATDDDADDDDPSSVWGATE